MMRTAILVFDVGTTNFKTMVFGTDGMTLFTRSEPLRPSYSAEGMVFQDPADWRNAVVDGAAAAQNFATAENLEYIALSVTASRSSVIPVDKDGNHTAPAMMWQETASRDIVARVNHGDTLRRIFTLTGSRPNTIYSAPKMTWLRQNQPDIFKQAHKLVGIQDYIIAFLTGELVTDHTFGSRTLLMNIHTRTWDKELLEIFGVGEEKLCRLIQPGSIVGGLRPAAATITGLKAGLPVVTAGGDQNNAALGAGVTRQGDVMINTGTGTFLVAALDRPVTDPAMRVMCNASAIPDKYIVDAGMPAAGSVHRWFVESFYNEFHESETARRFDAADAEAERARPGCDGLLVLPHFNGSGAPHWDSRAVGVFHGLTMGHGRAEMSRAVYEGIAGEIAANISVLAEMVKGDLNLSLAGGVSRCDFFNQLLADVCQRPLRLGQAREATARGAWSQAMVARGRAATHDEALSLGNEQADREFYPNASLTAVYTLFLARREQLFASLAPMRD